MTTAVRVRFLAEDIFDPPDDGTRYEVIDGELYVTKSPDLEHQDAVGGLFYLIKRHTRRHCLGKMYVAPTGLILNEHNGLQPDLVYVSQERADILTKRGIYGTPDLVVEVLSPSTSATDHGVKMRRYAASGIPHYWIVDPEARTLAAYHLVPRGYERTGSYGPGTVFQPALFPGLDIAVDEIWA